MKFNVTLSQKILIPIIALNLLSSVFFSGYLYLTQKKTILAGIDQKLTASAHGAQLVAEPFHDLLSTPEKINSADYQKLQERLTVYTNDAGVKFLYSMVLKGDKVKFTLSSYSKEDKEKGKINHLFDPYDDASKGLLDAFKDGTVHFDEYSDTFGDFRSVFIPCKSPNGTSYIVGADVSLADVKGQLHSSLFACIIIGACVFVASFLLVLAVVGTIKKILRSLAASANRIADGDLTSRVEYESNDELGQLSADMNRMTEKLRDIVADVRVSAENVANASRDLSSTAAGIATGADEVACQTGTIATASEEMAATSNDIASNCSLASGSSQRSTVSAENGRRVVQETIAGMAKIAEQVKRSAQTVENLGSRSEQIGQIVGTIEDIADQTNLLALNAAIEAARAGEQGRGFAVVADEVRALAERTTKATREIGEMIKAIQLETKSAVAAMECGVAEVEKGAESSEKSGAALNDILLQIQEVSMQISQIATAAEEQTATTNEITRNVQQVTEVVRTTAEGATNTAAASSQLASLAQQLQNMVGKFRVS